MELGIWSLGSGFCNLEPVAWSLKAASSETVQTFGVLQVAPQNVDVIKCF